MYSVQTPDPQLPLPVRKAARELYRSRLERQAKKPAKPPEK